MRSKTKIIGAVEIGTSKINVLVGELTPGRSLNIIGHGSCQSHGVIKGSVVDFRAASDAVHNAIQLAESSAHMRIEGVFLAQTGAHLEGFYNHAEVAVSAANNTVSASDIESVCRNAKNKSIPEDRLIVHNIQRSFSLDGRIIPDAVHLVGQRLGVGYWIVHGLRGKIADHYHIVRGYNVEVDELILSSLASGTMVTSLEDRQNGVLVIDIGAGTTDYVCYRHGRVHTTGVLPVGGGHITNDLSLGLRLTEGQADKIKLRFGRGVVAVRDKTEKVWLNGDFGIGDRQLPKLAIEQITAARVWEIFEVIKKKLGADFSPENMMAGVVITGGTSKLEAIAEAAAKVFECPARIGELPGNIHENLRDPSNATVVGLLHLGLNSTAATTSAPTRRKSGFFGRIFSS